MHWAMKQATGDPRAQCLLYVVADTADENGIAWPSADWMAQKSQQSRATVYRRLAQMQELGILVMFPRWIDENGKIWNAAASGRRRTSPEIRLQLGVVIAAKAPVDDEESTPETDAPLSPAETGVVAGSDTLTATVRRGSSHCGDDNHHSTQEKIPPNPPSGGHQIDEGTEQRFQQFKSGYPDGIVDLDAARREFCALEPADQVACVAAEAVYADRCRRRREKSMKAHLFVRKRAWIGLLGTVDPKATGPTEWPPSSPAARALVTLGRVARYRPFRLSSGNISFNGEVTPRLLAMANAPPESEWGIHQRGSKHFAAWRDLINTVFAGCALPALTQIEAPWPWPPRKDGEITSTDPPDELATASELDEFAQNG